MLNEIKSPHPCFPFPIRRGVWLNKYSTFRIGGPARYFKEVHSAEEAQQVFRFLNENGLPFIIIGKGSNCLFDDRGFDGFVLYNNIQGQEFVSDTLLKVHSGVAFSMLGKRLALSGFSGLEFSIGIPGSVGGAVFMNAGISSQDVASVLDSVEIIRPSGEILLLKKEDLEFSYRSSRFHHTKEFILSATFKLSQEHTSDRKMRGLLNHRLMTQPYQYPSAGCVFKNPPGESAGKLIDLAGLKGLSVGGAKISEKHGNFIVNTGRATSKEVCQLIQMIRNQMDSFGITLQEEIRIIPFSTTP